MRGLLSEDLEHNPRGEVELTEQKIVRMDYTVTIETAIGQCIDTGVATYLLRQAITTAAGRGRLREDTATELGSRLAARG